MPPWKAYNVDRVRGWDNKKHVLTILGAISLCQKSCSNIRTKLYNFKVAWIKTFIKTYFYSMSGRPISGWHISFAKIIVAIADITKLCFWRCTFQANDWLNSIKSRSTNEYYEWVWDCTAMLRVYRRWGLLCSLHQRVTCAQAPCELD